MPKIRITEVDNTGAVQLPSGSNVVYIPGGFTTTGTETKTSPKLYFTKNALVEDVETKGYTDDLSLKMAKRLLELGLPVLYQGFKVTNGSISIDWPTLEDRNLYDIRFLTTGGYANPSVNMVACAAHRGDCVALIDHEDYATYDVATIRDFYETFATNVYTGRNADNAPSFAAGFTPWFHATWTSGEDKVDADFPASFGYLLAFARSVKENPIWKAVAGSFRGTIPELKGVKYEYTSAEVEVLAARAASAEVDLDGANDNVGFAINPIALENPFGYLVWGDRTLRVNEGDTTSTPINGILKATSQLHSRVLATEINKLLYRAAKKYTFEQNTDILWINFKSEVNPALERMKSGEGIGDFVWKRVATNKKARLAARVTVTPIDAVEDFDLGIYLEDSIDIEE